MSVLYQAARKLATGVVQIIGHCTGNLYCNSDGVLAAMAAGGAGSLDEMFARMADGGGGAHGGRGQSHDGGGGTRADGAQDAGREGLLGRIDDDLEPPRPAWKRSWK